MAIQNSLTIILRLTQHLKTSCLFPSFVVLLNMAVAVSAA